MRRFSFFGCLGVLLVGLGVPGFAQQKVVYISPNNDGVQDELVVPLSIKDKRYITEWRFVITDEKGEPVRTIGNKVSFPEKLNFKNFFVRLFASKNGVAVPNSVTWDGSLDTGEIAPDGNYFYYLTASDDNGNVSRTKSMPVVVDTTPPEVSLVQPASAAEKIFGEGRKVELSIQQSGSHEDLWIASFHNTAGTVLREYRWVSSPPASFKWDGKDDEGVAVPDGVYTYRITSTDKAGNTAPVSQITNIIFSGEKPSVGIVINGSRYFSPNKDAVLDTMLFDVTIPSGSGTVALGGNRLVHWQIDIVSINGTVVKTFQGQDNAPVVLFFDGTDDGGRVLADGSYMAVVKARYSNGYETPPFRSPLFILDTVAPSAVVRAASPIFSPDGDGRMDILELHQEASLEKEWKGEILNAGGKVIRTYNFSGQPSASFVWEGLDSQGVLCEDGMYTYRLSATDQAGNTGEIVSSAFELSTGATEVILTVQPPAFSPNGDGVQDSVVMTPVIKSKSGIASYNLQIQDGSGATVRTIAGTGALPARFSWNGLSDEGMRCADGNYSAVLETVSKNGGVSKTLTPSFLMDTVAPEISLSSPYALFSPDGDGAKDDVPFSVNSSQEELWTARIEAEAGGNVVQEFSWEGTVPDFLWDGTDTSGNLVKDGRYRLVVSSQDAAGNKGSATLSGLTTDTRPAKGYLTLEEEAFSPNGDGFKDHQNFSIRMTLAEGIQQWSFEVEDETGAVVRAWTQDDYANVPAAIRWDGRNESGKVMEGKFSGRLTVHYTKGTVLETETSPFVCTVTPPQLSVRTAPEYFSPDNDGVDDDLYIALKAVSLVPFGNWSFQVYDPENGKVFWSRSGTGSVTERLVWDGRGNNGELVQSASDYPFIFTVADEQGMESQVAGLISVDVLVMRVGDVLKIQVPSIIFRSDAADFKGKDEDPVKGLDKDVIDNNIRVLKRIAQILNKFKEYTVRVEGHANNISGTEAEETSTANGNIPLVPLSEARAEKVREMLIEFGVNGQRLSTVGVGGRQPIVPRSDRDNWWKNRRVEFILNK